MSLLMAVAQLVEESRVQEQMGNLGGAFERARQALALARAGGDADAYALTLVAVANLEFGLGHFAAARGLAEQALAQAAPDTRARVDAVLLLGMCAGETDDLAGAEEYLSQAINLSRRVGYDAVLLRGLTYLASSVYAPRGQFDLALAAGHEALRLAREGGLPEMAWGPLVLIAWVYWLTCRLDLARAALAELQTVAAPGSLPAGYLYCILAHVALDEGLLDQAAPLYAQARSIAETTGSPELNVQLRLGLSRHSLLTGDASAAVAWAADALAIAVRTGYAYFQALSLIETGRAAWVAGDPGRAEVDLRDAIAIMMPLKTDPGLARACLLLAALLHSQATAGAPTRATEARETWQAAAQRIARGGLAYLLDRERDLAFPLVADYLDDPELRPTAETLLAALQRVPPAPLRILALGRFEVWQGTRLIDRQALGQRRGGELLALLLITPGHSLSRYQISETLWPGLSPQAIQVRFHHATSALRRALEPYLPDKFPSRYLDVYGGQVTLHLPGGSSFDVETFERHVRLKQWQAAVDLYRGDLFPNALYADWAVIPRESLSQLYQQALFELAKEHLAGGRPQDTLDACQRILAREPWDERAVLVGMQACLALRQRARALRLYRRLAATLQRDLRAEPMVALQTLYNSLTQSGRPGK